MCQKLNFKIELTQGDYFSNQRLIVILILQFEIKSELVKKINRDMQHFVIAFTYWSCAKNTNYHSELAQS